VERDALNFFEPFERLPPNHENQLTRALLLILRLSPVAHAAWLARAAPTRRLHELPVAIFNTQRRAVRVESNAEDQVPVISVFLAPNQPLGEDVIVKESDRLQVLDAVIEYGDALVMVVENKVAEASDAQARELNITGAGVVISGLGVGDLHVGDVGNPHLDIEGQVLRLICRVHCDGVPQHVRSESGGAEPPVALAPVERSTTRRAPGEALPGAPEALESFHGTLVRHSVAVVLDPDLHDALQLVLHENDPDLVGIGVERVPNQLRNGGEGRGMGQRLKVVRVELDFDLHRTNQCGIRPGGHRKRQHPVLRSRIAMTRRSPCYALSYRGALRAPQGRAF